MNVIFWQDAPQSLKKSILNRNHVSNIDDIRSSVRNIIEKVRQEGDAALRYYTKLFDNIELNEVKIDVNKYLYSQQLSSHIKEAIDNAYKNIKNFHELQKLLIDNINEKLFVNNGAKAWREYRSIETVGLYVPGGTAPLVSTLLMLAIPATIAGCKKIVVATPLSKNGVIHPAILYAAKVCNIEHIYSLGGAQAIAAMAYGTKTIPKVMKIFGPGNKYVTEAKLQVSQDPYGAALDMPAGPSEVLVIADHTAEPRLVALDLLAQAEHDMDAKAICITFNEELANKINIAIQEQLKLLSRKDIINKSLKNSYIIIVNNISEALEISNNYASEHLILQIEKANDYISLIQNAGSVFLGHWTAEAFGDYASGTNHVLPTYGYAKNYSGLSVESFMKTITFQEINRDGVISLANTVESLADFEGLDAHKMSVSVRKEIIKESFL